jgi:hypothetical protein
MPSLQRLAVKDSEYITHKLVKLFPTRDYNRVISSSPNLSLYYPKAIQNFNSYIDRYVESLVSEEERKIESELENVPGFIDVEDKRKEIGKRLGKIVENDEHLKEISSKFEEMAKKEGYDDGSRAGG